MWVELVCWLAAAHASPWASWGAALSCGLLLPREGHKHTHKQEGASGHAFESAGAVPLTIGMACSRASSGKSGIHS